MHASYNYTIHVAAINVTSLMVPKIMLLFNAEINYSSLSIHRYYYHNNIYWKYLQELVMCCLRTAQAGGNSHYEDITSAHRYRVIESTP